MPTALDALAIGLVDELTPVAQCVPRAIALLDDLFALPSAPMLATRAMARTDLVEALTDPKRLNLDQFLAEWNNEDTQAALKALVARLKK
jgi:enoyl-CoA hydratase/carnithine racemase